ncbi:MAG: ADP-ribosylglycohydrolase family protein [Micrococcaceae bacterium]
MTDPMHPAPAALLPDDFAQRAEALLRISATTDAELSVFLFDGLLEWIEWANQGYESDPTACVWLGGLRWWRAQRGSLPEGAPPVPPRWVEDDAHLRTALRAEAERNLQALDSDQMPTLRDPAHPDDDGPGALSRSVIYALVPGLEDHLIVSLARQGAALTQGVPTAWEACSAAAVIVAALLFPDRGASGQTDQTERADHAEPSVLHRAVKRALRVLDAEPAAEVKSQLDTALEHAGRDGADQAAEWPSELRGTTAPVVVAAAVYAVSTASDLLPPHPDLPDAVSVLTEQLRAAQGQARIQSEERDLVTTAVQRWMTSIT